MECDDSEVKPLAIRYGASSVVTAAWIVLIGALAGMVTIDHRLSSGNRTDLSNLRDAATIVYPMAIAGSAVVGSVLAVRRPRNPAGWLFLALALSVALAGAADSYGSYGAVYSPGSLPAARLVAVYGDGAFGSWVCLLALILLVTPTGSALSARWKSVAWAATVSGVTFLVTIPFRSTPLDTPPFEGMTSPLARDGYSGIANAVALAALILVHAALVASIGSLIVRIQRAGPEERQQLRWLLVPAIPFPFLVAGAWFASGQGNPSLVAVLGGGYLMTIPVAVGLAIEKRRLFDVDRIISRTVTYTLLSGLVLAAYVLVVVVAGVEGGEAARRSVPAAVVATLAAIGLGGLTRKALQDEVDRRFNRRSFTALQRVRRHVQRPSAGVTIQQVLSDATGDPSLYVAFWSSDRDAWVTEDGTAGERARSENERRRTLGEGRIRRVADSTRLA